MMRLRMVLSLGTALAMAIVISGNAGAASMSDFTQAVAEAKASLKKAASVGGEWRDSGKLLKKADAAAKKGDLDAAIKLANKAKKQGEMGHMQAMSEKKAGTPSFVGGPAVKASMPPMSATKFTTKAGPNTIKEGKVLAVNRKKGNCLGCHMMDNGVSPGNIGPPLIAMKARYPDKGKLRAQIWDASAKNSETLMPPFGRHKALSDADIDKITEYVWSL